MLDSFFADYFLNNRCDTFEVLEPVEGMNFSIKDLILTSLSIVGRSTASAPAPSKIPCMSSHFDGVPQQPTGNTSRHVGAHFVSGTYDLCALEQPKAGDAAKEKSPDPADPMVRGEQQLSSSSSSSRVQGVVAVFLPRNTHLKQLASLVPEDGVWHVERNFVNGRLKGITLYCFS